MSEELSNVFSRLGALEAGQQATAATLKDMDSKLDSLLASRSFVRGAWKGIVMVAGAVSTVVALLLTWAKGH